MRASGMCLLALALVGASACERKDQPTTGTTETTSGDVEQRRAQEEQRRQQEEQQRQQQEQRGQSPTEASPVGEVPSVQYQQREKAKKAKEARKAEEARKAAQGKAPAKAKPGARAPRKESPTAKKPTTAPEREEAVIGETTITAAEVEVPPTTLPTPPAAERPAPGPGALPEVPGAPPGAQPYENHSTVFGDGKSGTYTDGQGTYGGRATWGTGGGLQPYPPPMRR